MKTTDLTALLDPVVAATGLEIDRVEVLPAGRRSLVRIFLDGDGSEGRGPSLDEIAEATLAISAALDASTVTGDHPYTLEVSSRGVGRPLTEAKHFRRNTGRLVQLGGEDLDVTGRIVAAGEDGVELDVDGDRRTIGYDRIASAVVQVELNRPVGTDDTDDEEE